MPQSQWKPNFIAWVNDKSGSNNTHVGCVQCAAFLLACLVVPPARPKIKILGDAIRHYRDLAGISQEKLAEKADLHPVYIGKVERGEQWISLHALLRIAGALGVRSEACRGPVNRKLLSRNRIPALTNYLRGKSAPFWTRRRAQARAAAGARSTAAAAGVMTLQETQTQASASRRRSRSAASTSSSWPSPTKHRFGPVSRWRMAISPMAALGSV